MHGVLLVLLWLLAVTGIVLFARWLSHLLRQTNLPTDTQVLILVAFVGVFIVAIFSYLWDVDTQPTQTTAVTQTSNVIPNDPLDAFESTAYPDLHELRKRMLMEIAALDQFANQVQSWATQIPNQQWFLRKLLDMRWERLTQLRKNYQAVDLRRREFWLHYNAGQNAHVRKMFDSEAIKLQQSIRDALGESLMAQQQEVDYIQMYLKDCITLLHQTTLPPTPNSKTKVKSTKMLTFPSAAIPAFQVYSTQRTQALSQWLTQHQENSIVTHINQLRQDEAQIRAKIAYILEYRKLNKDLTEQINQLVEQWNEALKYNQYAQYRLLFSSEALQLLESLIITTNPKDVTALVLALRKQAPLLWQAAEQERMVAEFSYQPEAEYPSKTKR